MALKNESKKNEIDTALAVCIPLSTKQKTTFDLYRFDWA